MPTDWVGTARSWRVTKIKAIILGSDQPPATTTSAVTDAKRASRRVQLRSALRRSVGSSAPPHLDGYPDQQRVLNLLSGFRGFGKKVAPVQQPRQIVAQPVSG